MTDLPGICGPGSGRLPKFPGAALILTRSRYTFVAEERSVGMFLGIDVGTGGTRAVLVNPEGMVVASAASEHAPIRSEHIGWAEQEPEDWWRAAREAIAAALVAGGIAADRDSSHRSDRPDARLRDARCGRQGAPPSTHLVRPAYPAGVRLAGGKNRPRAPDRADLQPGPPELHPDQAALGAQPTSPKSSPASPTSSAPRTTSASA